MRGKCTQFPIVKMVEDQASDQDLAANTGQALKKIPLLPPGLCGQSSRGGQKIHTHKRGSRKYFRDPPAQPSLSGSDLDHPAPDG